MPQPWHDILANLLPFWMVAARLSGLFLFAPILASQLVARQVRILLVVMLTVALFPAVASAGQPLPPLEPAELIFVLAGEILIGLALGLMASMPLVAVQIAGSIAGFKLGLAIATVFNPESNADSAVIGQLLFFAALALFVQVGGLELMLIGVMHTFEVVPPATAWLDVAPAELFAAMLDAAFVVAMRIAMPVLVLSTLASLAMGVLMRTIPQINVLTIGFAIQILLGMMILAVSSAAIGDVIVDSIVEAFAAIDGWVESLTPRRTGVHHGG
ncbi:MAG: flagellar biosynthetic protein FliR [Planctomycetota bacterium]